MKMTFKRGFIGGMVTVSVVFGLYLCFFNHPPASDTLEANAHHHGVKVNIGPPKFDFGPAVVKPANPAGGVAIRTDTDAGAKTNEKTLRDQGTGGHSSDAVSKAPSSAEDIRGRQKTVNKTDGGSVAKNTKAPKDSRIAVTKPRFDWDKWVSENSLVDVGTIWGHCEEPDPPVIGKVLLMKDEDRGGLKVVVVLNTTFDKPVESGSIFVSVMYGDMSFYDKSLDICTLFEDQELEPGEERDTFFDCPMAAGSKYYMKELHVPMLVPSGHFSAKAKLIDENERIVLCSSADLKL